MNFVKGVFLDGGQPSFSRVFSGLIVSVSLSLLVFLTLKDGKLPDLGGLTVFVTGAVGVCYSANKIANAIAGEPIK